MYPELKNLPISSLEEKISEYFASCDDTSTPYTLSGLALSLDTTRDYLLRYEDKLEYSELISRAKERILKQHEERLVSQGYNTSGITFSLKNSFGFADKQEIKAKHEGAVTLLDLFKASEEEEEKEESN